MTEVDWRSRRGREPTEDGVIDEKGSEERNKEGNCNLWDKRRGSKVDVRKPPELIRVPNSMVDIHRLRVYREVRSGKRVWVSTHGLTGEIV